MEILTGFKHFYAVLVLNFSFCIKKLENVTFLLFETVFCKNANKSLQLYKQ